MITETEHANADLAKWIDGEIVTDQTDRFETRIIIFVNDGRYSIVRAFPLADGIGISLDAQGVSEKEIMRQLLRDVTKG